MKNEATYFKRLIDNDLLKWKHEDNHKPILLRGARQVGKSSAVRNLAKHFDYFLEINFEEEKAVKIKFILSADAVILLATRRKERSCRS